MRRSYGVIVAVQIIRVYLASKISITDDNKSLTVATGNIADKCFGSSEQWSELLIIPKHTSHGVVKNIYQKSTTSNRIVFPNSRKNGEFEYPRKCEDHYYAKVEEQGFKPTAVIISTNSLKELDSILSSLKTTAQRLWRPGSYFLVILETRCNSDECNNILKVIWDYWILNAVILCLSNNSGDSNESEVELYTFNPYSDARSPQWETIIYETVEVSIHPGNFNHSWYIYKQKFAEIESFEDCRDLFFDKTCNLDGYLIPIGAGYTEFYANVSEPAVAKSFVTDNRMLKTLSKLLRFDIAKVSLTDSHANSYLRQNGPYSCQLDDLYKRRTHLVSAKYGLKIYPGIEMTYPHDTIGACFVSRAAGDYPHWMNLAFAKPIWIAFGIGILFSTVVLYMQNKPYGMVLAFLNAERLVIGTSIIRGSTVIKHRIILGSIFLVILVVDGAIRGRFISLLTVVRPYPNLNTLEQIKEHDVDMYGPYEYKNTMMDPWLKTRYGTDVSPRECLDSIGQGENRRVCFTDCVFLTYEALNSSIYHKATTPVWSSYATILTTIHWPMTNRYSTEMQKLLESGIMKKWKLDILRECEVENWAKNRATEPSRVKPLKLKDLIPAFVLLILGLSVALIVFAWEIRELVNLNFGFWY